MSSNPEPRQIITALLPYLRLASSYAQQMQSKIKSLPSKDTGKNFLTAALSDADLAIQNLVEVALLGTFPDLRFHGEEYEQSRNTKYFRSIELGLQGDYLITLDPIDGTQYYLDGHDNYQIILSILNADDFEAVIALSPAQDVYYYAIRGEGAYYSCLSADLETGQPLRINDPKQSILLGWGMKKLKPALVAKYEVIDVETCYSAEIKIPNYNGIFSGDLAGWVTSRGKFIDSAALAFLAKEAGCIITTLDGSIPPPLDTCENYSYSGLIVASSVEIHQDLLAATFE
jgi:myo-inositol-1(or 4)-monophosphatase